MASYSNSQTILLLLNMNSKSSMNSELPFPFIKYHTNKASPLKENIEITSRCCFSTSLSFNCKDRNRVKGPEIHQN